MITCFDKLKYLLSNRSVSCYSVIIYVEHIRNLVNKSVKIKGTIDFEAYLPYRGTREDSEWLEFQNLSILGDKFIKPFNIKAQKQELWSGCSGIGLERWTAAFLAQKGLDPGKWPDKFNEKIGEMPKGVEFM